MCYTVFIISLYDESVVGNGAYLLFIWLYKNNLLKWSDKVVAH